MSDPQEIKRRAAEREHDHQNDLGKRMLDAAARDAQEAIKVALLINGGAAVAILAFMGSLVAPKGGFTLAELKSVGNSLYWFVAGIVAAGITSGCAYFCNSLYAGFRLEQKRIWEWPYVESTKKSARYRCMALWLNWIAVGFAGVSLLLFVGGVYIAASAIVNLGPK
jgi:hypothetical protein